MEIREHAEPESDDERGNVRGGAGPGPGGGGDPDGVADPDGADAGDDTDADTAIFTLGGDGAARTEQPELHRLLHSLADGVSPHPRGAMYPRVVRRAATIRRRRRALRASSVTAVLAVALLLGPTALHQLGLRGGTAAAAPPSAVVDLASAYPADAASTTPMVQVEAARPANALNWPARGAALPDDATDLAVSYLVERGVPGSPGPHGGDSLGGDRQTEHDADVSDAARTATVSTLWAGVEDDTTSVAADPRAAGINVNGSPERLIAQGAQAAQDTPVPGPAQNGAPAGIQARKAAEGMAEAHKTWLFVMQGWTAGLGGTPTSQATLLVGEYTQSGAGAVAGSEGGNTAEVTTSMTVYATPLVFTHARPGSGDDKNDTDQIAELSVWLPESGRLLVLGAPQTQTVLYAKTGGDLIPQKTADGVALFPRTRSLVKGRFADTIQVRDAKNVALTPPRAWSAADYEYTGAGARWDSTQPGWVPVGAKSSGAIPPGTKPPTRGATAPEPSASALPGDRTGPADPAEPTPPKPSQKVTPDRTSKTPAQPPTTAPTTLTTPATPTPAVRGR